MKDPLQFLIELQSIEFNDNKPADAAVQIAELRAKVPTPIIAHYDRLMARGKKGVALVRHQTCMSCHVSVPLGVVMTLKHGDDLQLCGNCGRYLYLDETPEPVVELPKKKQRRRKAAELTPA